MRLLVSGLAMAAIVTALPYASQDQKVNFTRTFVVGETETYTMTVSSDTASLDLTARFRSIVKQLAVIGKPTTLSMETLSLKSRDGSILAKPSSLNCTVPEHNLPSGLSFDGSGYLYVLMGIAGYTPDKMMKLGDMVRIAWSTSSDTVKVHGKAEVTAVDPALNSITSHIAASITWDGQPFAKVNFTSVSDLKSGALKSSTGAFGTKSLKYQVKIAQE